ncbi:MerR family transcriptional regulator [Planotetraspora mira]|jgi:DNA-binding transcriptional MerR regulator|uniref:MerR family transcriptional regulator n=2 Tax=Planotetraspora mira TaxID=58121 RepID=A0A8J3X831_9ACTN|nr:MerR family transcriptional regulator [Planotetraspora mira]
MRIGELSRRTGVSARSLRYYEQQGLIHAGRGANGYREYDEAVAVRAANIRDLLDAGLTVEDIRDALDKGCLERPLGTLPRCEGALRTATDRLAVLDGRIATLLEVRERLAKQVLRTRAALGQTVGS